jgi:aminoglycoside 2''-phosphotransferase
MDLQLCQHLIKTCCPILTIKQIKANNEGWVYFVAEVNEEYIFRFPRHHEAEKWLKIEAAILPSLGAWVSLPIPQFDFICKKQPEFPWMFVGYLKIPGVPMTNSLLKTSPSDKPARDLGLFLTQLHNYPIAKVQQAEVPSFDSYQWRGLYETFYQQIKTRILPILEDDLQARLQMKFQIFLNNKKNFQFQSTLIHRDLGEEHILWDRKEKRITGIIDWNDVSVGDPAFDFTGFLIHYGEVFTRHVMEYYQRPLDATAFDRVRFYSETSWCHCILYAQESKDQQLLAESTQKLRKAIFENHS